MKVLLIIPIVLVLASRRRLSLSYLLSREDRVHVVVH